MMIFGYRAFGKALAMLTFVDRLPHVSRLGRQDVPITPGEPETLGARLPGVDVGQRGELAVTAVSRRPGGTSSEITWRVY